MVSVFGISCPQVVFRMDWLVTVMFSVLITDIRSYLVNFKLHNSKNHMSVSECFMGNVLFAQLSINPQSSIPACSSLVVNSRNGSLGKVS